LSLSKCSPTSTVFICTQLLPNSQLCSCLGYGIKKTTQSRKFVSSNTCCTTENSSAPPVIPMASTSSSLSACSLA
jgi:hypothetical protein